MSALDDKIETIQALLSSLTWRKIALMTTFLAILGFSYATFDNRFAVYEFFSSGRPPPPPTVVKLSSESIESIDKAVDNSHIIVAIQIILVDFQRNSRVITYSSIDNQDLKILFEDFLNRAPTELPLFNNDMINNQRLVNLVNGDFECTPYKDTLSSKLLPASANFVSSLCTGPIPPLYGRFAGIVVVYLSREPTGLEIEQTRALTRNLGLQIFNTDLR